ncbi:cytoplasmic protein [Bacillus cereus]|nr:cytoplasmic protein [Bacillus cereus]PGU68459.1 cytoplasmic protein [Bacillus cereus]
MEAIYKTKDVTNKTGIPKHIVRKYSQLLEKHGYIISKTANARIYKLDDLKLLKSIHERAATLQEDISETIPIILKEKEATPVPVIQDKQEMQPKEYGRNFEEFMLKLEMFAQLNEAIIHQISTLLTQNRLKDEKLDELMKQVYIKEGSQEKMIQELVDHAAQTDALQKEKMDLLMNHMYKRESRQEEKMNKLVNQIYKKDGNRDAQLMQVIREIQETKKMVAASKEQRFFQSFKNLFSRTKQERTNE